MMEKLTVDAEGRIIIPSEVIQKRGLRPAMNSHSSSLMTVSSFTRAVSTQKLRRGTDSTTGSECSQKMMLDATRV